MIKAIIFDVDGVVNKSETFSRQYQNLFGVSNDEMISFFRNEFQNALIGKADLKEIIEPWLSKWKWPSGVDEFLKFWFQIENNIDLEIIKSVLNLKSKGIKCVVGTNQEKYRSDFLRDNMQLGLIFDKVYSSAYIGAKKPESKFFEYIAKDQNMNMNEFILLDDDEKYVELVTKLGIQTFFITSNTDYFNAIKQVFNI